MGDRNRILQEIEQTVGVDVVGPTRDDPDHLHPDFDAGSGEGVRGSGGASQQFQLTTVADDAGVGLDMVRQFVDLRKQGHSTVSAASELDIDMGDAIDINNAMLDMGIDPEQAHEDFNEWVETGQVPFDLSARGQQQSGGMGMGSPFSQGQRQPTPGRPQSGGGGNRGRVDKLVDQVAEAEIREASDLASIGQVFAELSQMAQTSEEAFKIGQILHGMMVEKIQQTVSEATGHFGELHESTEGVTALEERVGDGPSKQFQDKIRSMGGMSYGGQLTREFKQLLNDLKDRMSGGDRDAYKKLRWVYSKSDHIDVERMLGRPLDSYERKYESFDVLTTTLKERHRRSRSHSERSISEKVESIESQLNEMIDHLFKNIPNDAREVAKEYGLAFQSMVPDAEDKTASQNGQTGLFLVSFPDEPRGDGATAVIRGENNLDQELYVKVHIGTDADIDPGQPEQTIEKTDPSYLAMYFPSKNSRVAMRLFPHNWTGNLSLVMQHITKLIQWEGYHYSELQGEADMYLSELM